MTDWKKMNLTTNSVEFRLISCLDTVYSFLEFRAQSQAVHKGMRLSVAITMARLFLMQQNEWTVCERRGKTLQLPLWTPSTSCLPSLRHRLVPHHCNKQPEVSNFLHKNPLPKDWLVTLICQSNQQSNLQFSQQSNQQFSQQSNQQFSQQSNQQLSAV